MLYDELNDEPRLDAIPNYALMLEQYNKGPMYAESNDEFMKRIRGELGNPNAVRGQTAPSDKIGWASEEPKIAPKETLYDTVVQPGVNVYKKYNKGYYEEGSKIPEELK